MQNPKSKAARVAAIISVITLNGRNKPHQVFQLVHFTGFQLTICCHLVAFGSNFDRQVHHFTRLSTVSFIRSFVFFSFSWYFLTELYGCVPKLHTYFFKLFLSIRSLKYFVEIFLFPLNKDPNLKSKPAAATCQYS